MDYNIEGGHVPTDAEWTTLTNFLGGESIASDKLKETGTLYWNQYSSATNESNFTAFAGGCCDYTGQFSYKGTYGFWWSSTQKDIFYAWPRKLTSFDSRVYGDMYDKTYGFSVRCVKD